MFYVIGGKVKEVAVEKRTMTMDYFSATASDGSFSNLPVISTDLFDTISEARTNLYYKHISKCKDCTNYHDADDEDCILCKEEFRR